MATTDLPLDVLRSYAPDVLEPEDFDDFWATTLQESRRADAGHSLTPVTTPITGVRIEDLTFSGFGGEPVRAWVTRPVGDTGPLPAVIEFQGYNGGRGLAGGRPQWGARGGAPVFMDTRGQGSGWGGGGDTPAPHGSGPAVAGFMTRGIQDPAGYYYRRLFTDAVRLVDLVKTLEGVDAARISLTGGSRGGGIAIAASALSGGVRAVMPDVPFLCHFRRAVEATPQEPFTEITRYLSVHREREERVFETLSYFDGVNFAKRIGVPAYFSVALMDDVVLPSTVFAAYNRVPSTEKSMEVYAFNGHEGGQFLQWTRQAAWLAGLLG
ncbi:acetyl xylan esterase [Arthrobacter sp. RIT-PI-e]|uniref:acetylxylan esterase n=1 Tax=Arthrobacter sp. RIT-PI-e TaxID=1681197 RepID=UPI000676A203|nr:acetylxylan esterase [Arthrobacter sp. RIT-PI-e]KNC20212.1 acetyl xylan esterase [Arthrobacter sp. RIT-PI-e]